MSNKNVKTSLEELKDTSALMLDLAYSSIFFNNKEIDELISRVIISENSQAINKTLRELGENLVVNMIAIRRKKEKEYKWIFDPKIDTKISAGDTIIIVAHENALHEFSGPTIIIVSPADIFVSIFGSKIHLYSFY